MRAKRVAGRGTPCGGRSPRKRQHRTSSQLAHSPSVAFGASSLRREPAATLDIRGICAETALAHHAFLRDKFDLPNHRFGVSLNLPPQGACRFAQSTVLSQSTVPAHIQDQATRGFVWKVTIFFINYQQSLYISLLV